MKISIQKLYEHFLEMLMIILPVNYMVFNVILGKFFFFKYIKDIIMFLIIALWLLNLKKNRVFHKNSISLFYIIFCVFFIIAVRIITSNNILDSLYATRLLAVPIIFLCVLIINPISEQTKNSIYTKIFILTIIICIWGIFQAYVLGDDFLIGLNYKGMSGRIPPGFYISGYRGIQRVVATFAAPNLFAMYLNFVLFFSLFIRERIYVSNRIFRLGIVLFIITDILTFSRSGWIGLIIEGSYYFFKKKITMRKQVVRRILITIIIAVLLGIIFSTNNGVRDAFELHIFRTFNGTDASLVGHIESLIINVEKILNNPLGYNWLGYSGARTRSGVVNYNVESSVLLIGLELGILGMLAYTVLLLLIYFNASRTEACDSIRASFKSIVPLLLFLPLIYEYELITLIYVLLGISMGQKKQKEFTCINTSEKI